MSPLTPFDPKLTPDRKRQARAGFSLIELMVVIVIIGILLALLLPAIGNIRGTVRTSEISTEIQGFSQGIAEFKTQYGMEPPSGITIYEAEADWDADVQSKTLIRQMWPQFDFSDVDRNGNASIGDFVVLTGDECLVFFLGGASTIAPANSAVADGFSSDPSNPFSTGGNRVGPFAEFDPDRLIDLDGDGAHAYDDLYQETTVGYLYLSSYEGRGYRTTSTGDIPDYDSDGQPDLVTAIDTNSDPSTVEQYGYSPYMQRDPDSTAPGLIVSGSVSVAREANELNWNENSFQIICAGADGIFGCGGIWSEEDGLSHSTGVEVINDSEASDNITNFSGGTLE